MNTRTDDQEILLQEIIKNLNQAAHITTKDVIKELNPIGATIADAMPQLHYAGFSCYSILIPELLALIKSPLVLAQPQAIGMTWNIADAILQIIFGIIQIHTAVNKGTHKPVTTGLEGGANIASGVQLIALTALSASLGAIGFSVAFGVAFAFSMKNTIESACKYLEHDYWLEDSLEKLALMKSNHKKALHEKQEQIKNIDAKNVKKNVATAISSEDQLFFQQIAAINDRAPINEQLTLNTLNLVTETILQFIKNRLIESEKSIQSLQTEIFARLLTDYVEKGEGSYLYKNYISNVNVTETTIDLDQFTASQSACLIEIKNKIQNSPRKNLTSCLETRKGLVSEALAQRPKDGVSDKHCVNTYAKCEAITRDSINECRKETCLKAIETLYIGMAFAGMVCLCIPVAQVFAPLFIAPATVYFTAKYSVQIASATKSIYAFFAKRQLSVDPRKSFSKPTQSSQITSPFPVPILAAVKA